MSEVTRAMISDVCFSGSSIPWLVAAATMVQGVITTLFWLYARSQADIIRDLRRQRDGALGLGEGALYVGRQIVDSRRALPSGDESDDEEDPPRRRRGRRA